MGYFFYLASLVDSKTNSRAERTLNEHKIINYESDLFNRITL